jgi:membrane-associated phospholipid phosphatase
MGPKSSDRGARKDRGAIHSLAIRLIAGKLLLIGALALAVTEISVVARADIALAEAIHNLATGWLTSLWLAVSELAATDVILLATTIMTGLLIVGRHWHGAAALALSVLAAQAVVELVKLLISRPRPEGEAAMVDPSGFSFPSAHSASAVALYLMLAVIAAGLLKPRLRATAYVVAGLVVAMVGFSRVYLGAHYPTDVLAGWLLGGAVVLASWRVCSRLPAPAPV